VISEHQFATHYSSSWSAVSPLADGYWTLENMMVERFVPPLVPRAPKGMRAVVNETAFRAFCDLHGRDHAITRSEVMAAVNLRLPEGIEYVARFSTAPQVKAADVDDVCRREAGMLAIRQVAFFSGTLPTILRPQFMGCGLISACEGDVIQGDCLYEIKAGERSFRIIDLRQLLTYSALAYASGRLTFSEIGLFNPRRGVTWRKSLEDVCHAISGQRLSDTLSALVENFSVSSASR
jgi:hypothetical protein